MITASSIRNALHYNPDTGAFTWLHRSDMRPQWNGKYAGKIAGCDKGNGYIKIAINNRAHHAHRLAWLYVHGSLPSNGIDHVDGNPSNNRIANLRPATQAENMRNIGKRSRNTSGFKGVSFHKQSGKWIVRAKYEGKNRYFGLYDTAEQAAAAYDAVIRSIHGEFARPNGVERGSTARAAA